ncbi:MAG: MFS transporter, partial [Aeriscardovia sp.]|nr:MFS transporter [Aeriscardovia sp.]
MVQSAGAQVTGSVFVVMAVKYLASSEKVVYLGINNAVYFFACMIGVVAGGFIEMIPWKFLLLLFAALAVVVLPLLLKNIPDVCGASEKVDAFGITVSGL